MSDRYNKKNTCNENAYKITSPDIVNARNDLPKVLISTEPSPTKIPNYKIDVVRSPEVSKCRLSVLSSLSKSVIKSRKKQRTRYSEPRKLPINIVRVEKRFQDVKAKRQLAEFCTGSEGSRDKVDVLNVTNITKTTDVEPSTSITVPVTTSNTKPTDATSQQTILNDTEIPEMTKTTVAIRTAVIQNVDSPCKQLHLPCESDNEVSGTSLHDQLVRNYCLTSSEFSKETPIEQSKSLQSENDEILCSPEVMKMRRKRKSQPASLLERYQVVKSKLANAKWLFSYEMEAGLRMNSGQFVTCDLIVTSLTQLHGYLILHCKSTSKICEVNNVLLSHEILVISNYLRHKVNVNSVIKLHFPFTAMLDPQLNALIVMARYRIVQEEKHMSVQIDAGTNLSKECTYVRDLFSCKSFELQNTHKILHVINSSLNCCIHECILAQSLVSDTSLDIIILHLFKSGPDTWTALTCDKECRYCLIEFNSDKRNLEIAKLIELESCKINITGIRIIDIINIDSKMAQLIDFVHKDMKNSTTIYKAEVWKENLNIICLQKCLWPKIYSNIYYILAVHQDFKRFCVKVERVSTSYRGLYVSDGSSLQPLLLNFTQPFPLTELKMPFTADAIFYFKGELFADTYSKMLNV